MKTEEYMAPEKLPDNPVNASAIWSHHESNCRRATEDIAALVSTLGAIDIYVGDAINFLQQILSFDLDNEAMRGIAAELSKLSAHEAFIRLACAQLLTKTLAVNHESKRVFQKKAPITYVSHFRDFIAELPVLVKQESK